MIKKVMTIVNESKVECWFTLKFLLMLLLLFFLSLLLLCSVLVPCVVFSFFSSLHFLVCFFVIIITTRITIIIRVLCIQFFLCTLYCKLWPFFITFLFFISPISATPLSYSAHAISLIIYHYILLLPLSVL